MTDRLVLGTHPSGPTGLFISKPGVDVLATDPGDTNAMLFSTQWSHVLAILMAGVCVIDEVVTLPSLGFRPFVRWEARYGSTNVVNYDPYPSRGATVSAGDLASRRYDWTRFILVYLSDTSFRISKKHPALDATTTDDANVSFRFLAFNLPVNA